MDIEVNNESGLESAPQISDNTKDNDNNHRNNQDDQEEEGDEEEDRNEFILFNMPAAKSLPEENEDEIRLETILASGRTNFIYIFSPQLPPTSSRVSSKPHYVPQPPQLPLRAHFESESQWLWSATRGNLHSTRQALSEVSQRSFPLRNLAVVRPHPNDDRREKVIPPEHVGAN